MNYFQRVVYAFGAIALGGCIIAILAGVAVTEFYLCDRFGWRGGAAGLFAIVLVSALLMGLEDA